MLQDYIWRLHLVCWTSCFYVFMLFTHNILNNQRTHFSILVLIWHTTIKSYLLLRTLFFYEILCYLSIRCPLILTKKLKAHMSTVDGKQYVINAHEAFCHTLFKKTVFVIFGLKIAMALLNTNIGIRNYLRCSKLV